MKRLIYFVCLLILVLDSCVEPFNIELTESEATLVVDGEITDQPGPYTIRLFRTADLQSQFEKAVWVTDAQVWILDDLGNQEQLGQTQPGYYSTSGSGLIGQIGRSYYTRIIISDGSTYESQPEKLLPVGEILNLYSEFELNEDPDESTHINTTNGFKLYVDSELLPEQQGLVRWRWKSTFEILTFPQFKTKAEYQGRAVVIVPDPPQCSGYFRRGNNSVQFDDCFCCVCWIEQFSISPVLPKDGLTQTGLLTDNQIAFIPASRRLFHKKVHIEVEQLSVSPKIFEFWKKVEAQKTSGSDLFQTPPPATVGNIKTLTPNSLPARGIFSASSIKSKSIFIDREEVPYFLPRIDTIKESCLKVFKIKDANSTTSKPIFW
jgi:Domain of unknown function (DUF4249)